MKRSPEELGKIGCHNLLSSVVVPRPVAWISTMSNDGVVGVSPYSFFAPIAKDPPRLMFIVSKQRAKYGHELKDTDRNIRENGEFVVHIPSVEFAEPVDQSADFFEPHVSEVEVLGLKTVPSDVVKVPRLVDVPVAMECVTSEIITLDEGLLWMVIGEVKMFHVRDDLYDPKTNIVDTRALNPLMRVGNPYYASVGELIKVAPRPNSY